MKFVVIGGTGLIGSKVVSRLRGQGHEVIAASPSTGIDILSGEGLDAAMAGTGAVVDLSNSPTFDAASMAFFQTAGRNLLGAEARAGVRHHVALSVVGTEKLSDNDYFRAKLEQERLIRDSGIPYTIVHSTQFFEFLPGIIKAGTEGDDKVRLSTALVQPIAAEDVADAVARLAAQSPANGIVDIAGPERAPMSELAKRFMSAVQDSREVVADAHARYFGTELQRDTLVPEKDCWQGALDFERWLDQSGYARQAAQA